MAEVFDTLFAINVNDHTEKKKVGGTELTYLSWAYAWAEVKKLYPNASYEIERFNGLPYVYDENTGYMVFTKVTIEGITHEMWLPVMDGANKAMKSDEYYYTVKNPNYKFAKLAENGRYYDKYGKEQKEYIEKTVEQASMFDINKTIMRCLVKNLAMFGLGLYIYAGEDLPEGDKEEAPKKEEKKNYKKSMEKYSADKLTQDEVDSLRNELERMGVNIKALCGQYGVNELAELTPEQYINVMGRLNEYNRT